VEVLYEGQGVEDVIRVRPHDDTDGLERGGIAGAGQHRGAAIDDALDQDEPSSGVRDPPGKVLGDLREHEGFPVLYGSDVHPVLLATSR